MSSQTPTKHEISLKPAGVEIEYHEGYSARKAGNGERDPPFPDQLAQLPPDAKWVSIKEDVPSDEEWEALGSHLTSVENLEVDAGFDEFLNDRLVPQHWPLKRLLLSSSCGEVIQNPHILLGKIQHLILLLTAGLRFEGPTSKEMIAAHNEAVKAGETEAHHVSDTGVTVTYGPDLYNDWLKDKYDGKQLTLPGDASQSTNRDLNLDDGPVPETYNLTTLEIFENDAIDTFVRFTMALPHLAHNLQTLTIRSTQGLDLSSTPPNLFPTLLSSLHNLSTLTLSVGDIFRPLGDPPVYSPSDSDGETSPTRPADPQVDPPAETPTDPETNTLHTLHTFFPGNLTTLHFRGPISLTQHPSFESWLTSFADPTFLPRLQHLSFVCDLDYTHGGYRWENVTVDDDDELARARDVCARLLEGAEARGVVVDRFEDQWPEFFEGVDERWYS